LAREQKFQAFLVASQSATGFMLQTAPMTASLAAQRHDGFRSRRLFLRCERGQHKIATAESGSESEFAALVTSGRFGKQRRSLRAG
jgi:hypothetical protein